jgi:hypothetical protein
MGMQSGGASAICDFKKAYDSVRRMVLYNISTEFDIPLKIVRLLKVRLSKTYKGSG